MKKKLLAFALAAAVAVSAPLTAMAAWEKTEDAQWKWSENGTYSTGWDYIGDEWYYFDANGIMQTGWELVNGTWYYLNADGSMHTGWLVENGTTYYLNEGGDMRTGWFYYEDEWYYFNKGGDMRTGWGYINNEWYYFNNYGVMQTGVLNIDGDVYAFEDTGEMITDEVTIGRKTYQISETGALEGRTSPEIDKYFVKAVEVDPPTDDDSDNDTGRHVHDYVYDSNNDGTHEKWCVGCGYSKDVSCSYETDKNDPHLKVCKDCGYKVTTKHNSDGIEKIDSDKHKIFCTVCKGNVEEETHTYGDDYECECGAIGVDKSAEADDEGVIDTYDELVAAIESANDGDVIYVEGDIIDRTTTDAIEIRGKSITLIGETDTVVDAWFMVWGELNIKGLTLKNTTANNTSTSQYTRTTVGLMNEGDFSSDSTTFVLTQTDSTAITAWWSTGDGANIEVTNCTFNCNGQRPIRSDACVTVEGCTFNDPYRYAVQMTSKSSTMDDNADAFVIFNDNTIINGENGKDFVYGVQLEGGYGCSNLTINGEGNTIENGGELSTMYYCECDNVDHATVVWNTEEAPVHNDEGDVAADIQAAVAAGNDVTLPEDITVAAAEGGYGVAGLTPAAGSTLDGGDNTLTVTGADGTWNCAIYTTGGTIKNLTVGGAFRGIFTAGCSADIVVDNVVIDKVCYAFSSDGSNPNYSVIFTNSTLNGWTSYASGYKSVSFTDCKFGKGTGGYQYAYMRPFSSTTLTNCEFEEGFEFDATRTSVVFENCTVGGVALTQDNLSELLGTDAASATVK